MKIAKVLTPLLVLLTQFVIAQNTNLGTNAGNAGTDNTSIGYLAGDLVTGNSNTFLGSSTAVRNTSGYRNTYLGYASGFYATTANVNVFVGNGSGYSTTTGSQNVFLGSSAGFQNTTGMNNTYVGESSGANNVTGTRNTYVGQGTGYLTSGSDNSFFGYLAGRNMTTGVQNTFVGVNTGLNTITGSGNVFLGYNAGYSETGSNKLYIDNSSTTTPLIYGDFTSNQVGINALPASGYTLNVGGTIQATGLYVNGQQISGWASSGTNINYSAGIVSIGTTTAPAGYKLAVGGKMIAEELILKLQANWPDYVFEEGYHLPTAGELEAFIKQHKHLPGVPSAKEVQENGVSVGEMNVILLQKIEELTLKLIDLEKKYDALTQTQK
jgi:hypothetical protein